MAGSSDHDTARLSNHGPERVAANPLRNGLRHVSASPARTGVSVHLLQEAGR